jgi:hypothetical protein
LRQWLDDRRANDVGASRRSENFAGLLPSRREFGPATWRFGDVQAAADAPVAAEMAREAPAQAPRNVGDGFFGSVGGDSEEKIAHRHTSRGQQLAAEDRRYDIRGGAGDGGLM